MFPAFFLGLRRVIPVSERCVARADSRELLNHARLGETGKANPMKEHVAEIVAAYVGKNRVDPAELRALIASVNQALVGLGQAPAAAPAALNPAVSIRHSVGAETITCLDCGQKSKMPKWHLSTAHGMTVDEYRTRWRLPTDYPMVAKNYSARRSELAKSLGLGRGGRSRSGS